MVNGVIGFSAV